MADRTYREAFASNEGASEPAEGLMGSILGNWALLLHDRGLLDEAKLRYEQALVIQQQTLGKSHPMIALLLDRYAGVLRDLGQRSQAGLVESRAAAIRTQQIH
jgi:serine/threonine-protein kinase